MTLTGTLFSCWLVPMQMNCVLSEFNFNQFDDIQASICCWYSLSSLLCCLQTPQPCHDTLLWHGLSRKSHALSPGFCPSWGSKARCDILLWYLSQHPAECCCNNRSIISLSLKPSICSHMRHLVPSAKTNIIYIKMLSIINHCLVFVDHALSRTSVMLLVLWTTLYSDMTSSLDWRFLMDQVGTAWWNRNVKHNFLERENLHGGAPSEGSRWGGRIRFGDCSETASRLFLSVSLRKVKEDGNQRYGAGERSRERKQLLLMESMLLQLPLLTEWAYLDLPCPRLLSLWKAIGVRILGRCTS